MPDAKELKSPITWEELTAYVEEWIGYGDDVFDDAYSWIDELMEKETNEEQKKVYQSVLKFMDMLRKHIFHY
jgi:hypothetical protein